MKLQTKNQNKFNKNGFIRSLFLTIVFATCYMLLSSTANAGTIIKAPAYLGLQNGLVGYWTFDGTDIFGTSARDLSGNGNHGTITGALGGIGKIGQGLNFNRASSNYVRVTDANPLDVGNVLTYSIWFKRATGTLVTYETFFSKSANTLVCAIGVGGVHVLECYGSSLGLIAQSTVTPTDTNWHHLAVTKNGSDFHIYIDGIDRTGTVTDRTLTTNTTALAIGVDLDGSGNPVAARYFNGILDDFRMYSRDLSANEIARLYQIGLGSKANRSAVVSSFDRGLIGHWTFDGSDISGSIAKDRSASINNGTIVGATKVIGRVGQALNFKNASNQYVDLGNTLNPTSSITLSGWAKFERPPDSDDRIISKQGLGGDRSWELKREAGQPVIIVSGNGTTVYGCYYPGVVPNDRWVFITGVYDASVPSLSIYVNGVFFNDSVTGDCDDPDASLVSSDNSVIIGGYQFSGNDFEGSIDEVRVYNRVLSASEINRLYQQTQSKFNSSKTDSLTQGLVGHWTFDGADIFGTSARDKTANAKHGTISGATKLIGRIGQALSFDGNDDYVDVGSLGNSVSAVSLWFYSNININKDTTTKLPIQINTDMGFLLGQSTGSLTDEIIEFRGDGGGSDRNGWCSSTDSISVGWHHLVATFDTDRYQIYFDGVRRDNCTDSLPQVVFATTDVEIGRHAGFPNNAFDGKIDDVRVYSRALSASEINKLYQMGR